ncbi:LysR family transcriptional regulator [Gluconacetobacter azotocaptans]|uniref:LysR family transcriptional regulator n=1 Tax=Gluconacetobacter azotocaptans TaxID=142834 RepID=UPI001959560F|nr:LysR family transcriptional regulator [Gluconacetobacter azotocaptans]MBM9401083.1 LysR family transcriptional regulator [Gluconacetobacter azotocaptans]
MEWLKTDLNLLKVFHAVLTEGSVSGAARRLHLTPSAISHQLGRLRANTGDPLFIRVGQGMVPTARALELSGPLSTIVSALSEPEMRGNQGNLSSIRRSIRIAMPPTLEAVLLPPLYSRLDEVAPGIDLVILPFERRSYSRDLLQGIVDFVLSVGGDYGTESGITHDLLYSDTLTSVVGPSSPLHGLPLLDIELWLDQPHIYSVPWPLQDNYLDQWLARNKRPRRIAVSLSHYGAIPHLLQCTRLVATLPGRLAEVLTATWSELRMLPLPAEVASGEVFLEFAQSFADQPALAATREFIVDVVGNELRTQPHMCSATTT